MLHLNGMLRDGLYIKSKPSYYSSTQLAQYLTRIGFTPKELTEERLIANGDFPTTLDNLERLIRLHVLAFPFENTAMHYEPEHAVDVDLQKLYHRFLDERKGSYCFGQNNLFLNVLRGLGYRAYHVAGRVNSSRSLNPTEYTSLSHLLILVQPIEDSNMTYMVDVGFGVGPIRPMLLFENNIVTGMTALEKFRLTRRADPRSTLESREDSKYTSEKSWVLEVQHLDNYDPRVKDQDAPAAAPWMPQYSFSEDEFYQVDIINASLSISSRGYSGSNWFQNNVIAMKHYLLDEEGTSVLDPDKVADELANGADVLRRDFGRATLIGKEFKLTKGGRSELTVLKTEGERIGVLRDVLGIVIEDDKKSFIEGLPSALEKDI